MKIWILTKTHIKRLIRKPIMALFLLSLPFATTIILNFNFISEPDEEEGYHNMMLYVWDASDSEMGEQLVKLLEHNKEYYIHKSVVDSYDQVETEIKEQIKEYSLGVHLYLPPDFEERIKSKEQAIFLYEAGYDERVDMLKKDIGVFLSKTLSYENSGKMVEKQEVSIAFVNAHKKVADQIYEGYSFSWHMFIACLGITFVMIDSTLLSLWRKQGQEHIENRMRLAGMDEMTYSISKLVVFILMLIGEVISCGIGIKVLVKVPLDIPFVVLMYVIMLYGLVLSWYCQLMEYICKESQSATYISTLTCNVFNLLAGMYFPVYTEHIWQQNLTRLMPQYWVTYCVKAIKRGSYSTLGLYTITMIAFIVFQWIMLHEFKRRKKDSLVEEIVY